MWRHEQRHIYTKWWHRFEMTCTFWWYLLLALKVYFLSPELNLHLVCICLNFLYLLRCHPDLFLVSDEVTCLQLNFDSDQSEESLTALFTKPPAGVLPGWNHSLGPFQPLAPFTAYGSFRNYTEQNHGTAGNREAGSFVNSAIHKATSSLVTDHSHDWEPWGRWLCE